MIPRHRRGYARLHPANVANMRCMTPLRDRLVLVPAVVLDDTLELARTLVDRLPHDDPLALALRGSIGQLRAEIVMEP